mgnify:FL=1
MFLADTTVNERPTASQLADIATQTAEVARRMGHEPRVAFMSYSNFGNPQGKWIEHIREAVLELDQRQVDFEYEGEMTPEVALNAASMKKYPFSRLSGPANVLVMPGLQSANISAKLLRELGGERIIGPLLINMEQPVQIASMSANASELMTLAVLAAAGITG